MSLTVRRGVRDRPGELAEPTLNPVPGAQTLPEAVGVPVFPDRGDVLRQPRVDRHVLSDGGQSRGVGPRPGGQDAANGAGVQPGQPYNAVRDLLGVLHEDGGEGRTRQRRVLGREELHEGGGVFLRELHHALDYRLRHRSRRFALRDPAAEKRRHDN